MFAVTVTLMQSFNPEAVGTVIAITVMAILLSMALEARRRRFADRLIVRRRLSRLARQVREF